MKPPLNVESSDDFQTPPEALYPLYPFLKKGWIIWECASGKGNLAKAMIERGYSVRATDILNGRDFLTWAPDQWDCIVTNPPFSLKQEFLERCYRLGKPFALLLPLTALETPARQALFRDNGVQLVLFDKRINFETPSKKGGGSWFATAWFTHGLGLPKDLNFVKTDWRQTTL